MVDFDNIKEEVDYILAAQRNGIECIPVGRHGDIKKNKMVLAGVIEAITEIVAPHCYSPCDTAYTIPDEAARQRQSIIRHKLICLINELNK